MIDSGGKDTGVATFLVEHYWPGITAERFEQAAERVRRTAQQMADAGAPIRFLHSTLVLDDEAAYCVFEAESQALVDEAYARAGVRYERLMNARQIPLRGKGVTAQDG